MATEQRVSGWSRSSLWFGMVWLAIAVLAVIIDHLNGQPWWEQTDITNAKEALEAGTSRAATLIAVSTGAALVGTMLCVVGIGQCWRSLGKVGGLGQACAGMMMTGLGTTATVYVAIKQVTRPNPLVFAAIPGALAIMVSWVAWRLSHRVNSTFAAMATAEPLTSPTDLRKTEFPGTA